MYCKLHAKIKYCTKYYIKVPAFTKYYMMYNLQHFSVTYLLLPSTCMSTVLSKILCVIHTPTYNLLKILPEGAILSLMGTDELFKSTRSIARGALQTKERLLFGSKTEIMTKLLFYSIVAHPGANYSFSVTLPG